MEFNTLIPELTVRDIEKTKAFYLEVLGFQMEYERKNEKFIFLSYEGSQMMFEQFHEEGWNIGDMEYPLGQGINFQIESSNIDELYRNILKHDLSLYREMNVSTYQTGETVEIQKEFLLQDPDGYLLRFTGSPKE